MATCEETIGKRVASIINGLPPIPGNLDLLIDLIHSPGGQLKAVDMIVQDPGMSMTALNLANACGGHPRTIETVEEAIACVGLETLISTAGVSFFHRDTQALVTDRANLDAYIRHSREIARTARILARVLELPDHEQTMFATAGVIHDIGRMIILLSCNQLDITLLGTSWQQMSSIVESEQQILGINHCDIGAGVCSRWGFPLSLTEAVLRHHTPMPRGGTFSHSGAVLFLSHFVSDNDFTGEILTSIVHSDILDAARLTPERFEIARRLYRESLTTGHLNP
jgi:putative nucleotidyltransferase with HDIG domain